MSDGAFARLAAEVVADAEMVCGCGVAAGVALMLVAV